MLRTVLKATVCAVGIHDWNKDNQCARCRRAGCLVGHHDWRETDRQVVVSPRRFPNNGPPNDAYMDLVVTTTTRRFYECRRCGESTQVSRVEEGYLGRA